MKSKRFSKLMAFMGVFAGLALVLAACAPAVTPGAAPREIQQGPGLTEEVAPFGEIDQMEAVTEAPAVSLSEADQGIVEAATLEDVLGRQLDSIQLPLIDSEVLDISSAPIEGFAEEHMVTEFPKGVVTLDDEFLSAYGLAAVIDEGVSTGEESALIIEESAPLIEEGAVISDEFAPMMDEAAPLIEEAMPSSEESVPATSPMYQVAPDNSEDILMDGYSY